MWYAYKCDIKIKGATDSDRVFVEVGLTNKFGAFGWNNFYCGENDITIDENETFTLDTVR